MASYILAVVVSISGDPRMTPDVCVPAPWPARIEINRSVTFADLQELYLHEAPEALMPEQAVLQAETVAKESSHKDWEAQAEVVGAAVYQAQIQNLETHCGLRLDNQHGAAGLIEQAYARVLAHTDLRQDSVAAAKLLPEKFSINLTPRVAIVGLSVNCSESTPALGSFLTHASIPCGRLLGLRDGR